MQDFEFVSNDAVPEEAGVLIVFCPRGQSMRVMEVFESSNLRDTVSKNAQRLGAACGSYLRYQLVVEADKSSRMKLAYKARAHYSVP